MEIIIDKSECIENLHNQSAHLAVKLSAPEYIASTDEDKERIMPLLSASFLELHQLLSPYAELSDGEQNVRYKLSMPKNWKDCQYTALDELCREYVKQTFFARWLDFVKADSAAFYRTLNQNIAMAVKHILALRKKPVRTK